MMFQHNIQRGEFIMVGAPEHGKSMLLLQYKIQRHERDEFIMIGAPGPGKSML